MQHQNKMRIAKSVCWLGVVVDGVWAVALFWPSFFAVLTGRTDVVDDVAFQLVLGIAGSLMAVGSGRRYGNTSTPERLVTPQAAATATGRT